jgi:hypothetical protein
MWTLLNLVCGSDVQNRLCCFMCVCVKLLSLILHGEHTNTLRACGSKVLQILVDFKKKRLFQDGGEYYVL